MLPAADAHLHPRRWLLLHKRCWHRTRRHAANVSVAQQLVGPLRARADLRFSLHVPGGYSPVRSCSIS